MGRIVFILSSLTCSIAFCEISTSNVAIFFIYCFRFVTLLLQKLKSGVNFKTLSIWYNFILQRLFCTTNTSVPTPESTPPPLFWSLLNGWGRRKEGKRGRNKKEKVRDKNKGEKKRKKNAQMAPPSATKKKP